jgi:peptidyl-prolyl cis-trans isomerase SurA
LPAYSQLSADDKVYDKILAVAGNEVIMLSDLNDQLAFLAQQDPKMNPSDPKVRKQILDAMINEKLVITKAIEDSIELTDDEVNSQWDYYISNLIKHYGSTKRIEDIYGISLTKLKQEKREDFRKQLLAERIKQKEFGEIKANAREVDEYFNKYKDSMPNVPIEVEFYHIVKYSEPSKNAKEETYKLAMSIRDSIIKGLGKFEDFARRYSADAGTASAGGDLDWVEKGKLISEFEKAAFSLAVGVTSEPIETPFGYHLIQTLDKNKDSVRTRHILFKIGQGSNENEDTKKFLLDLKAKALKDGHFEDLANQYSEDKLNEALGGMNGVVPVEYLPVNMKEALGNMKDGEISDPLPYTTVPKESFHIIYKKRMIPEHRPNLKDDYKDIEQLASVNKQNKLYNDWIEKLRKTMYWEIKEN